MKKVKFLTLIASIATLGFFATSCSSTTDTAPVITPSANCVVTGSSIALGDSVLLEYTVTSDNKLATVEITDQTSSTLKSFSDVTATIYKAWIKPSVVGTYTFNLVVVDKKDLKSTSSVTITVTAALSEYTTTLLFAPTDNKTSKTFISTSTGTTYEVTGFSTNSSSIDFGYFYGASNHATLASSNDYLTTAYNLATLYPNATLNATTFAKVATGTTFASLTSASSIQAAYVAGTLSTDGSTGGAGRIKLLDAGSTVAFKTAAGKYGVISVVSVSGTSNAGDKITIDVKVQK